MFFTRAQSYNKSQPNTATQKQGYYNRPIGYNNAQKAPVVKPANRTAPSYNK